MIGINGVPNAATELQVRFNGIAQTQSINIALDELNHIATEFSMSTVQDGLAPSKLSTVRVNSTGVIQGISTTGQSFDIAQLAIALFKNPQGLTGVGQSYFDASLGSGDVELGAGGSGGRGIIRGGQLEGSNVDVAFEFTQLIVAQRGFSANARTITVTNQVLEELTNIIR
jgi:flagellar hook protein FlgE